jgi:deoxyuridine 5'-triphosphate nucleotidohydrolase
MYQHDDNKFLEEQLEEREYNVYQKEYINSYTDHDTPRTTNYSSNSFYSQPYFKQEKQEGTQKSVPKDKWTPARGLYFKKLADDAQIPQKFNKGDAGWDLFTNHNIIIRPRTRIMVYTGVQIQMPQGAFGQIVGRSSLMKKGIEPCTGTVDEGYTGEIQVILKNESDEEARFKKGDRIAQLLLLPQVEEFLLDWEDTDETTLGERGDQGFGSTGLYYEQTVTPGEYLYEQPKNHPEEIRDTLLYQMFENEQMRTHARENF